jgi:hypothetical protein
MITEPLPVGQTKNFLSVEGADSTVITVSVAPGSAPGSCQVRCPGGGAAPADHAPVDGTPSVVRYVFWGAKVLVQNTGTVDLTIEALGLAP